MATTQIALIGCGVIAQAHLTAFRNFPNGVISALCDVSPEALARVGEAFGISRLTTSAAELFSDPEIEGVILALPTGVRTRLALEALRAGKHVLLEKPAAMNTAEIDQMEAARSDRIVACCSARFSHYPSVQVVREFLRSGCLGTIRTMSCRVVSPPRQAPPAQPRAWRLSRQLNGGGILVNWGTYDLDFLFSLLDFELRPAHVLARTWRVPPPYAAYAAAGSDAETHVTALVTFTNGSVLDYERAEFAAIPPEQRWEIVGDNGTLSLQLVTRKDLRVVWWRAGESGTREQILWEGDESALDATQLVDANFIAAIRGDATPFTDLRKARLMQQVFSGIYRSAEAGTPISSCD